MKWSVIALGLATTAAGPLCWTSEALAQEAGTEAGSDGASEASLPVDAALDALVDAAADGGGTSEAGASVCMVDKDCPGGGNVCGGDVCSWCTTSMPNCKPPGGATSGVMCVPAASLDPGHCLADTDCKCNADAGVSAICCRPGSSFCVAHTCNYHNKLYTMPSDAGTSSSADAATDDSGGGSSSSGSNMSSSDNSGSGCNVSPAPSSAFVFGAAAAMLGLAFGLRRRR